MTTYADVFGNSTVPPSEYGYSSQTLTANTTLVWIYNYTSTSNSPPFATKIMDVSCNSGVTLTLPDATQVSTGEDLLIRNVGANALTVLSNTGTTLASIPAGIAQYFYLTSNTTVGGTWGQVTYGAGSSSVSAGALVGYGLTAIGATLNTAVQVSTFTASTTLIASQRAKAIEFTNGAATLTLLSAATAGNNFYFFLKNGGTGLVTITPAGADMIDGQSSMGLQPNESCMIVCTGTTWFTVGYGRSILYQFSQLVLDVSVGGTITLSAAQASNKLFKFIGNPSGTVTVVVPSTVAVYYVQSQISTSQSIVVKNSTGTGATVAQSQATVLLDDGTNVISAVSPTISTVLPLLDGSAAAPSLSFASQTNTGVFKYSTNGFGISVNGTAVIQALTTGVEITVPLVADGTLNVTGATNLSAALTVSSGGVNVTGNSNVTGNIGINGTATATQFVGPLNGTATNAVVATTATNATTASNINFTVQPNQGGTGATTLTANNLIVGAGTSPVTFIAPGTSGNVLTSNGTVWASAPPSSVVVIPYVRQTVLSGPVDSNGFSSFGGSVGAATLTMSGTLIATAAAGFSSTSASIDSVGAGTNLAWTSPGGSGTGYLYATISGNVLTAAVASLQPIYQWGGTPSVNSGQLTFVIQTMTGYLGNGSTAVPTNWVAIGECPYTSGSWSGTIVWYQLLARYTGAWVNPIPGASTPISLSHNVGTSIITTVFEAECVTAELNYSIGDQIMGNFNNTGALGGVFSNVWQTYKTAGFTSSTGSPALYNKTTGAPTAITLANWKYRLRVFRNW